VKLRKCEDALLYLEHIRHHGRLALEFARDRTFADLKADLQYRFAVLNALQVVGEAATKLPEAVRELAPDIAWRSIIGFRNVVVHNDDGLSAESVDFVLRHKPRLLVDAVDALSPEVEARGKEPLP
jgi:uncharacterized protein with HEPN domain